MNIKPRRLITLSAVLLMLALPLVVGRGLRTAQAQQAPQNRSALVLLCAYADKADTFGVTAADIQTQWTGATSISGYVREMSLGAVDVSDSRVFGWYRLPNPRTTYGEGADGAARIASECVVAAAAAGVNTLPFERVAVYLNDSLPGAAGRVVPFTADVGGQTRRLTGIMVDKMGLTSPGLMMHEVGHSYGGDHTSSVADPLGGGALYGDTPGSPRWGLPLVVANYPGWDGNNRDLMGFIPTNRKVTFTGGTQQITMARLTQPGPDGAMLVTVPIPNSQEKYVVSVRTRTGYDAATKYPADRNMCAGCPSLAAFGYVIPAPGVVIQRVAGIPGIQPSPMFSTPGGAGDSAAAVWVAGQTYTDAASGLRIAINRFDDNGAAITVSGPGAAPTTAAPTTAAPPVVTGGAPQDNLTAAPTIAVPATIGPQPTTTATNEPGEPSPCGNIGNTVWFRIVAPQTGDLTINTQASNYDTVLAAYRGPATGATHASLTNAACNDDTVGTTSSITIRVTAGETIYVQAGGYGGATGNLTVTVR